jgi:prepilin-type N-terminal cleavage/methylation domain-containing protein
MAPTTNSTQRHAARRGFTLAELMIVIMIIAILAAMSMSALSGAVEQAREQRTRAIISKIDQLITEKYESYKMRPVPLRVSARTEPRLATQQRLAAMRELMRMEMPERKSDLINFQTNPPTLQTRATGIPQASLQRAYVHAAIRNLGGNPGTANDWNLLRDDWTGPRKWTDQNQFAECLYLIISRMRDGDKNALDFFTSAEIGDTDEDGMLEILDGWGRPIQFLRWAPGYVANPWDTTRAGMLTMQVRPGIIGGQPRPYSADPFDPLRADPRWSDNDETTNPFELTPLIISAGKDGDYDIIFEDFDTSGNPVRLVYRTLTPIPNDPYTILPFANSQGQQRRIGEPSATSSGYADNITNHSIRLP